MKRILFFFLFFSLLALPAFSQIPDLGFGKAGGGPVADLADGITITVEPMTLRGAPGESAKLTVTFDLPSHAHLNSEPPPFVSFEQPWIESKDGTLEGKKHFNKLLESDVYNGTVIYTQTLRFLENTPSTTQTLQGTLSYFPCDDKTGLCYRLTQELEISFEPSSVSSVETMDKPADEGGFMQRTIAALSSEGGGVSLWLLFPLVLLAGILTSFTPCIYPMIPITLGFFGAKRAAGKAALFLHITVYTVGIASIYAVFGVAAALGGAAFGSLTQKPLVLGGVALVLFLMGMSLMGFFELVLPTGSMSKKPSEGILGTFLTGAMGGLIASPCVTPILVALLAYVAQRGSAVLGFSLLFVFAVGMSSLLIGVALFSSFTSSLPKAGGWMMTVKAFLGLVLIGVAVYYFQVMGMALGYESWIFYALGAGAALIVTGYALGGMDFSPIPEGTPGFSKLQRMIGFLLVIGGILLAAQGVRFIGPWQSYAASGSSAEAKTSDLVQWIEDDYDVAVLRAKSEGKNIFIDFWAPWCVYCLKLDKTTYMDEDVAETLNTKFVPLKLNYDKFTELSKKLGVRGLPTVMVITPEGEQAATPLVSYVDAEELMEYLNSL